MAERFVQEATNRLSPVYAQQEQALTSQVPAIQKLYESLVGGLEQQRGTETQNILESASARGVLRSSLPVDLQQDLGREILSQRAAYGAQQAQDISGINQQVAQLGIDRVGGIQALAEQLRAADLEERQFAAQQEADRVAAARAAASEASNNAAYNALIAKLNAANSTPNPTFTATGNRAPIGSFFGTPTALNVSTKRTQQSLLQPAGTVRVQATAPARTFQPAGAKNLPKAPKLQGAGSLTGGVLRVR